MYEKEKQEIINTAWAIKEYGLIQLSGGNVSMRLPDGHILVTPSGMPYEPMTTDQILELDEKGDVLVGSYRPSVDTVALVYIYDHIPEVNAIIHTHAPYSTAVGLVADELPACTTTLCNVTGGAVNVAPYSSPASINMGIEAVEHLDGKLAVILRHHGVVTIGPTLQDALYAAIYMEDTAKCYLAAKAAGTVALLTPDQANLAAELWKVHGQNKGK